MEDRLVGGATALGEDSFITGLDPHRRRQVGCQVLIRAGVFLVTLVDDEVDELVVGLDRYCPEGAKRAGAVNRAWGGPLGAHTVGDGVAPQGKPQPS